MRKILTAGLLVVAAGCFPQLNSKPSPDRVVGEYSYRIENRSHEPIEGVFAVLPDSVVIAPDREMCWRDQRPATDRYQAFRCQPHGAMSSFYIFIDGNRPTGSKWSATQAVPRRRQVCVHWVYNKVTGGLVCGRTRNETYFADSTFGGRLIVKQIASRD